MNSEAIMSDSDNTAGFNPIHWTTIKQPSLKDIPIGLVTGEATYLRTQKVLLAKESTVGIDRHPEVVIYDQGFVRYLIMQAIVPLIIDRYDFGHFEYPVAIDDDLDFLDTLIALIADSYRDMIDNYISVVNATKELGVDINWDTSTVLRSYKIYLASEHGKENPS